jgi:hypothetical protein
MEDEAARAWFQQYLDAFAAAATGPSGGIRRLLEFYGVPLVLSTDDGAQALAHEEDVLAFVNELVDRLRPERYSHTVTLGDELTEINGSTTLYRGEFSRLRTDGSEIARVGATYLIATGALGRRIFVVAAHPSSPVWE